MRLGLVTYNLAADWDLDKIIEMCTIHGHEGVELRTTHAHGVEVNLSEKERTVVRKKFESSAVELAGLGSAFQYHYRDPEEVRRNIEGTKEYARLAADVGAPGVKVRPNALLIDDGVPEEETLQQIGRSLAECGEYAATLGIQVRLEVHGHLTSDPKRIARILQHCGHPNVFVCWNSNDADLVDGSIEESFNLLADRITLVHMRDLAAPGYPWLDLLRSLRRMDYGGFCLCEIDPNEQPDRIMDFNKALWDAYNRIIDLED